MAGGRPTKYDEKYCEEIVEFFDQEPFKVSQGDNGKIELMPCALPTFERFAFKIGVHRDTLHEWLKKHPEFSDAYKKAKDLQKDILIQNGLVGAYDKTFAIFVAKNVTDMSDKQGIDHTSSDGSMTPRTIGDFYADSKDD